MPLATIADVELAQTQSFADFAPQRGSQIVEVRTFVTKALSQEELAAAENSTGESDTSGVKPLTDEVEIGGATCVLRGDKFSAEIVTPAGVRVPLYGHRTGDLTLECAKEGFAPAVTVVSPYNKTFAERRANAASGGLLGALIIEVINAASDETNDVFEYPFTPVLMKEETPLTS
jgi:hypothetical protein